MSPRPLSRYVQTPPVSTATLHLEWHEVRRRVRRHRQVRVASALGALLVVAGAAALALRPSPERFQPGQRVVAQDSARTLRLSEGSEVALSPGAVLELAMADDAEVVLLLERGRASFDVQKRPSRRFVVKADAVEVRVVGTKFTVQREGRGVEVSVQRGLVEVLEGPVVRRLGAGERWSRVSAPAPAAMTGEEERGERAPLATKVVRRQRVLQAEGVAEPARTAPAESEELTGPNPGPAPEVPGPADTFTAALQARADGQAKQAILGFQHVCERWPASAYAPMSAFEWGRLALETQDDPRQAARAFERTLELATSASLVEDALARLVEAYARYDAAACRRVQAEYLRRFPGGSHERGVAKACPP